MPEMNLNQQRAVEFKDGPMLLLAGPGSGKTFVLTHRIQKLISSGVSSNQILVITFTKAAALQMQERFLNLSDSTFSSVTFGTFHAIFFSILRSSNSYRKVSPVKENEKLNILKRALEITNCSDLYTESADCMRILGVISSCKNNGNNPTEYKQDMFSGEQFVNVFNSYNSLLKQMNVIDFDDMVNNCLQLLKENPDILLNWQKSYKYVLVDEFQDISTNQYELVKLLAAPENNIFVVGDDDQAIYGFRGSNVALMRKFIEDYGNATRLDLSINYRSVGSIVDVAGKVIAHNKNRFEKQIQASRIPGDEPIAVACDSLLNQYEQISQIIKNKIRDGLVYEEIAILVRTNRQGKDYATYLASVNIPYSFGGGELPLNSSYIRDICAYMSLAEGVMDRALFLRIMNKPVRYISREALQSNKITREGLLEYYRKDSYMKTRIADLFDNLSKIHNMRPYLAIHYICNTIGYEKYIKENLSPDKYQEYLKDKVLFLHLAKQTSDYRQLMEKLEIIWNEAKEDKKKTNIKPGVRIMTYHGSKGLEFDTVILPDANENIIPPKTAKTMDALEEERRMFYVAMTRAKDSLSILYRTDEGKKVSRFIAGIMI